MYIMLNMLLMFCGVSFVSSPSCVTLGLIRVSGSLSVFTLVSLSLRPDPLGVIGSSLTGH